MSHKAINKSSEAWKFCLKYWDNKCVYCGKQEGINLTVDHYVPKSKGGTNHPSNLLPCCEECNNKKANLIPSNHIKKKIRKEIHLYFKVITAMPNTKKVLEHIL